MSDSEVKVVDRRWWAKQETDGAGSAGESEWQLGKPTYVEELERQLAEKDRQLQDTLTKYRQAAREFEDTRARQRKDVARDVERGRRTLLGEFLEVLDNLDRAIAAARAAGGAESLVTGVDIVRRQFLSKLEGLGVTRFDPLGQPFDPARHEAVTIVPTSDPTQDGLVYGVLSPGYTIQDDVLRPAAVAVAQHSDAVADREP